MSATQYLPIPPAMLALACETVTRKVSRLPFLRSGVMITEELVGSVIECLNAEPTRALPLTTPRDSDGGIEGLDRILEQRLKTEGNTVVTVIAEVLTSAGITETADILDRDLRRSRKALRLLPAWTWHIASTPLPADAPSGPGNDTVSSAGWMRTCPICHSGVLARITGKQLFGIPRTDYIIECSHCGAKFIPVGPAFRLVSIAVIRDPLWKRNLDQTYTPEQWADIERTTRKGSVLPPRPQEKPSPGIKPAAPAGTLTVMGNGTLAVPVEKRTIYFRPVPIRFSGGLKEGTFTRLQTDLQDLIRQEVYADLRDQVNAKYSRYLPLKTGLFLSQLKERHDLFYREFLNPDGDEKFGAFRAEEAPDIDKPGVMLVVVNRGIYHACSCPVSFRGTINDSLGRIPPEACYRGGDATRCRINAVLSGFRNEAGLFIYASGNTGEQELILRALKISGP